MAKFNTKQTAFRSLANRPAVPNHEGGLNFLMELKSEFVTRVLATAVSEARFYTSAEESDNELKQVTQKVLEIDPEFVLKTAAFSRNEWNLRSVSLYLLNEYANSGVRVRRSRKYVSSCIQRPDEITELEALSLSTRSKKSNFINYGLRDAFNKFNRYQYGKYNRDGAVKLRDALFLCHPAPNPKEKQVIFDDIVNNKLESPETWEVAISRDGSSQESWQRISRKMPFMATLRNLSNFLKWDVDLDPVIAKLTDPAAIKHSKQFPFRYYSAFRAIQGDEDLIIRAPFSQAQFKNPTSVARLMGALNFAMEESVKNVPTLPGRTLVLVDASASMDQPISKHSTVEASDIAKLFGAIASKIYEAADVCLFATDFKFINFSPTSQILDRMEKMSQIDVGGSTYAYRPIEAARMNRIVYDRVILFSDMQAYTEDHSIFSRGNFAESFLNYQRTVNNVYLYSVDLTGYGTAIIPPDNKKVCLLSGWSDRIFDYIPAFESDGKTLVQAVESYACAS
jgi:hypothetical protein